MKEYVAIAIVLIVILAVYFTVEQFASRHLERHKTSAYLIHEKTTEQCYECRDIHNYFHTNLGNEFELDIHSLHVRSDNHKIRPLADKYDFSINETPLMLVIHDNGTHELYKGYDNVRSAIGALKYHPYIERRIGL